MRMLWSKKNFRRSEVRRRSSYTFLFFLFIIIMIFLLFLVIIFLLYNIMFPFLVDSEEFHDLIKPTPNMNTYNNNNSNNNNNGCDAPRQSFTPLGEFIFWGKLMNITWPCPTSGMNNQLMMMMGKIHCFAIHAAQQARILQNNNNNNNNNMSFFKWKDITCAPTGGKEIQQNKNNKKRYIVGGDDYIYMWFRWSEILRFDDFQFSLEEQEKEGKSNIHLFPTQTNQNNNVNNNNNKEILNQNHHQQHTTRVCLSDHYSWSEQARVDNNNNNINNNYNYNKCPASVDHIWGKEIYWQLRLTLRPHVWFDRAGVDFLQRNGIPRLTHYINNNINNNNNNNRNTNNDNNNDNDRNNNYRNNNDNNNKYQQQQKQQTYMHAFIGLHVRRGDYQNFCRENAHGRGKYKYRIPPFIQLKRLQHPNNTILHSNFWAACYPSLEHIIHTIIYIINIYSHINNIMLMTNADGFRRELSDALRLRNATQHLKVLSFIPASPNDNNNNNINNNNNKEIPPVYWPRNNNSYFTLAEVAWLDATIISMAEVLVLNRYSTFSHSVIDLHILREKQLAARLFWW